MEIKRSEIASSAPHFKAEWRNWIWRGDPLGFDTAGKSPSLLNRRWLGSLTTTSRVATGPKDSAIPTQSPVPSPRSLLPYSLFVILLLALFLRLYCLDCSSYWHDEGNTWALVQRTFSQIAAAAAADIHPPGYYWLLKVWSLIFGQTPWSLRAFSAVAGTLTVALVYAIASSVAHRPPSAVPLLAALFAVLNPFQIFYSQEARMYSLLMLESVALVWVLLWEGKRQKGKAKGDGGPQTADHNSQFAIRNPQFILPFSLLAAAGLWTHYIFPVILAAVSLGWLLTHRPFTIHNSQFTIRNSFFPLLLANLLALLLFLPWLPIAIERVLHWPAGGVDISALDGLGLTLQTLAVGPIRSAPQLAWPWLLLVGLLPLLGLWRLRHNPAAPVLGLWLLAPIGLMFGLGLFTDSFLKFLLVASPAWCIAAAYSVSPTTRHAARFTQHFSHTAHYALALAVLALAYVTLPAYYADPAARDNYAGMAATVAGLGDAATDLVILNAPGQADVWGIYDPGVPVLALPQQRPPDGVATETALAATVADRRQIFALFWATEQADPAGIVENWLNRHAFKGLESWQGNVRFVHYSLPNQLVCQEFAPPVRFGASIQLTRACLPADHAVVAGTSLPLSLHWTTDAPIGQRYKATLQLLNDQNQVIAQQDGEPGGGSLPTDGWQPGAAVVDQRGIYAPPGTPPVGYRLILALYHEETGQRLAVGGGDALELGGVTVARPQHPLPAEIVQMRARLNRSIGPLRLVGYDVYPTGYAHDPSRPLIPGDILHLTLYWQAPSPLPADWPANLTFTLSLGDAQISAPLAGADFPTGAWQTGDFVRGDVEIPYRGDGPVMLSINGGKVALGQVRNGQIWKSRTAIPPQIEHFLITK